MMPGPAVAFIVARTLDEGRAAGWASVLGAISGAYLHVGLMAFGIGALVAQSPQILWWIKVAGALFLLYLGIIKLLQKNEERPAQISSQSHGAALFKLFKEGVMVSLLNPKVILFFYALFPQFTNLEKGSLSIQILLLGLIYSGLAVITDGLYVTLSNKVRQLLLRYPNYPAVQTKVTGVVFLGLAVSSFI